MRRTKGMMPVEENALLLLEQLCPDAGRILSDPEYQRLRQFPRHGFTNTFDHSVRVALKAADLAGRYGVDPASAVKVGLLHDMCFINYYENHRRPKAERHAGVYAFYHPEEAADNGARFGLTEEEQKAIRAHMFPLAVHVPGSRLALVLTLADKRVAAEEGLYSFRVKGLGLMGKVTGRAANL